MSIESVMPSNHLLLCHLPLLLSSIFPSIRVFSNELALRIRWPEYQSFIFSISPSNAHSGLICFRIDRFDLLAIQGTLKSLLQHHCSNRKSLLRLEDFTLKKRTPLPISLLPAACPSIHFLSLSENYFPSKTACVCCLEVLHVWDPSLVSRGFPRLPTQPFSPGLKKKNDAVNSCIHSGMILWNLTLVRISGHLRLLLSCGRWCFIYVGHADCCAGPFRASGTLAEHSVLLHLCHTFATHWKDEARRFRELSARGGCEASWVSLSTRRNITLNWLVVSKTTIPMNVS